MHVQRICTAPFLLIIAVASGVAGGCASPSQGEKMVQGYANTRQFLAETRGHVDVAMGSMESMRTLPAQQLKVAFARYRKSVSTLEQEEKDARFRASSMKEKHADHIRVWQEEMASVTDPSIKSSLESRREAVRTNFALVQMYADDVLKHYQPFLNSNRQIVKALEIDLSPATLASLSEPMDRVIAQGHALQQRLAASQRALDNMEAGISPIEQ